MPGQAITHPPTAPSQGSARSPHARVPRAAVQVIVSTKSAADAAAVCQDMTRWASAAHQAELSRILQVGPRQGV